MIVEIPACWAKLIEFEAFPTEVAKSKHKRERDDDPTPYRDDSRVISATLPDGNTVDVGLYSGDTNYWAEISICDPDGELIETSEPLDELTERTYKVDEYEITLKFI